MYMVHLFFEIITISLHFYFSILCIPHSIGNTTFQVPSIRGIIHTKPNWWVFVSLGWRHHLKVLKKGGSKDRFRKINFSVFSFGGLLNQLIILIDFSISIVVGSIIMCRFWRLPPDSIHFENSRSPHLWAIPLSLAGLGNSQSEWEFCILPVFFPRMYYFYILGIFCKV